MIIDLSCEKCRVMGKSKDCSQVQERIREGNLWYWYVCLSNNLRGVYICAKSQ
jgi:hypothetical protein